MKNIYQKAAEKIIGNIKIDFQSALIIGEQSTPLGLCDCLAEELKKKNKQVSIEIIPETFQPNEELPASAINKMQDVDLIIECLKNYNLYTQSIKDATKNGKKVLVIYGLTDKVIKNFIVDADWNYLEKLNKKIEKILENTETILISSSLGTNLTMKLDKKPILTDLGNLENKSTDLLPPSTISVAPDEKTVNGKLIVDWSIIPPIGKINKPVEIVFKNGKIKSITGGWEAKNLENWLKKLNDKMMYYFAHISLGTNPFIKELNKILMNDERKAGIVTIGIGCNSGSFKGNIDAKSHSDFLLKNASMFFDGNMIVKNGELVI